MPPKHIKGPTKAEQIKAALATANALKQANWKTFWEHRVGHITKGENKGGTPVGYHTKLFEGKGAVCKTFGEPTQIPDSLGCYKQEVALLTNTNPVKGPKTKESTFFPTTFTLAQIEAVCKSGYDNAGSQDLTKNFSSTSTVEPGNGMKLRFSADSIYPEY
ncbi:MAG: EndoU domain-containing protein [Gemmatimonadaceae bacterium]|jgi:hypothetical protein|nr:EndoU domain-containing protein [Gemmatimonadaceae bacterium]